MGATTTFAGPTTYAAPMTSYAAPTTYACPATTYAAPITTSAPIRSAPMSYGTTVGAPMSYPSTLTSSVGLGAYGCCWWLRRCSQLRCPDLVRSFVPVDDVRSHDLRCHDLRWGDDCLRWFDDADGLIDISSFADEPCELKRS